MEAIVSIERSHEVVVVGGGISGASILYQLAAAGVGATLVERGALADGPTGRSSANVRLHYFIPELAELARRGVELFTTFAAITGRDCGFRRVGVAYAVGEADATAWRENVMRLRTKGFEIELRDPAACGDIAPGFDLAGVALVVFEPGTGYADPVGTTVGLAERARELGAALRTHERVSGLEVAGDRVTGVRLESGETLGADVVVLAAGPWTSELLAPLGVILPLHVERQAISILDAPTGARSVVPTVWGDFVGHFYARPEGDASLLLGDESPGMRLAQPGAVDASVSLAESADLSTRASRRVPRMAELGLRRGYASLYDVSEDRLHIIDWVPGHDGLFVVCGTSGHGFKLAPAIGAEVARVVTGGTSDLLRPFGIERTYDIARERSR
jgi:glycine/D-amino acid oxidase-like deaminating enzyme